MNNIVIGLIGALIVVLLNIFATIAALRAKDFLKSQIRNQIILAWLLPIIGAVIVISFHRSKDDEDPRDDGGNSSGMSDDQLRSYWVSGQR